MLDYFAMKPRLCVHGVDGKSLGVDEMFAGFHYESFEILHVSKEWVSVRTASKLLHAVTYNICKIQNKRML